MALDFRHGSERTAWYTLDGKKVLRITVPTIHKDSIPKGTLSSIRKKTHLNKDEFERLVDCPLSSSDYEKLMRDKQKAGLI